MESQQQVGKRKRKGKVAADRKPIGVCVQCGKLAYKRRPVRKDLGNGEYAEMKLILCFKHYQRLRRFGTLEPVARSLTPEDLRWMRRLQVSGYSVAQIREMLEALRGVKVSHQTVWQRLKYGYKPNSDYEDLPAPESNGG